MNHNPSRTLAVGASAVAAILGASAIVAAPSPAATAKKVTLSVLVDDGEGQAKIIAGMVTAYKKLAPNVTLKVETRPGGADGDNIVKTRLSTGTMADVFCYNSGSLFQALNPAKNLVALDAATLKNVDAGFNPVVSAGGKVYGVPNGTVMGGGVLYNKAAFAKAGISVPHTWAEFAANNDKLKAAGIAPLGGSYKDTWTSQLFVLADYYNVQAANKNFATDYTNNKAKYATNAAALKGFQRLEESAKKGWYQKDFEAETFDGAIKKLADGEVAQYPMLTFALGNVDPAKLPNIGYFGLPGDDANNHGTTLWLPGGCYIPKTSKKQADGKKFLAFIASKAGTDVTSAAQPPSGPYMVKGAVLPASTPQAVRDIDAYIKAGKTAPALEFLSPIKGPNLEKITVAVGTGQQSAADGAADYDKDVEKQAKQLGLAGW